MCTRYIPPDVAEIERDWHIGARDVPVWPRELFPSMSGPFIRHRPEGERELVVGQWGLIPFFAESRKLKISTVNARSETVATSPVFKGSWKYGKRCLIPAASFDEPNWETGKNIWWRFRRADGAPWALAGLWNAWKDPATEKYVESYTMLTVNADGHPLMGRMHRPDPKRPPEKQDKRSVVVVEPANWDAWLRGPEDEARALIQLTAAEEFEAGPV